MKQKKRRQWSTESPNVRLHSLKFQIIIALNLISVVNLLILSLKYIHTQPLAMLQKESCAGIFFLR